LMTRSQVRWRSSTWPQRRGALPTCHLAGYVPHITANNNNNNSNSSSTHHHRHSLMHHACFVVLVLRAWQRIACTWRDATPTEAYAIAAAPAASPRRLITLACTQTNVAVSSWGPLAIFAGGTLKRGLPKSDAIDIWNSTSGKCKDNLAFASRRLCAGLWPPGHVAEHVA
jgi:hypothetical protein